MDILWWHYVLAIVLAAAMDTAWIQLYMKGVFLNNLRESSLSYEGNPPARLVLAPVVWAILGCGLVFFALDRLSPNDSLLTAILTGAAYGFTVNGFYALTNYVLIYRYTLKVACHDGGWGTFMTAVTTVVIWLLAK
jgi:uncharacterized membrane protein